MNRLRATVTLLGVAIGIAAILAMVSINDGRRQVISNPEIGRFLGPLLGFDQSWVTWPFSVSLPWSFVSLGVGLFFGLYPAMKAARLTPMDALRSAR